MRFKLRQMEVFRAVMLGPARSIRRRRCFMCLQPAVSKLVAHTETTLGLRLFERAKGRLVPTAEAQALFREVEQVYQAALRVDGSSLRGRCPRTREPAARVSCTVRHWRCRSSHPRSSN